MKNKKLLTTLLALLSTLTFAAFAACDITEKKSSSSSENSSKENSSLIVSSKEEISSKESSSSIDSSEEENSDSIDSSEEENSDSMDSSEEESSSQESSLDSSIEESSSSAETSSSSNDFNGDTTDHAQPTEWSDWICDPDTYVECKQPTCTEDGVKLRYKLADETITETETIPARGHDYAIDKADANLSGGYGKCIRCSAEGITLIPTLENPTFLSTATAKGDGTRDPNFNALVLQEGCYELEIKQAHASDGLWISFYPTTDGQFAFYSVGENEGDGFSATRYSVEPASGYVNESGGISAIVSDGNFYSFVNPGSSYSANWCATYRIQGNVGDTVKVCFTKIAEKPWQAARVTSYAYATEINGTKAADGEAGMELKDVHYDAAYYFDEESGYYRLGSPSAPGAIIYAAISKTSRQFTEGKTFTDLTGQNLRLQDGYTADGDYHILNYVPMLMNWKYNNAVADDSEKPEVNPDKNCYQNYCNADGVYPVTKELYKFLNLYVRQNKPMDEYITNEDWATEKTISLADPDNWLWLANCYFYANPQTGTSSNPTPLTLGENTVTIPEADYYYVTVGNSELYTISWSDSNLVVRLNGRPVQNATQLTLQAPFTLKLSDKEGNENQFTLNLAYATQAVNTETTTLSPITAYKADSTTTTAYARYEYTPTEDGTFTLTRAGNEEVTVTIDGEEVTTSKEIQATANTPIVILVSADTPVEVAVTLAFVPNA